MKLFDLVRIMFTDPKKFKTIKNSDKGKNMFMINRFFAIKYPTTAQSLNKNGINPWAVIDLWQIVASKSRKVPYWIYTKTKKASTTQSIWKPDPNIAKLWKTRNNLSNKDFDSMLKLNPEGLKGVLDNFSKRVSMND
jgi:hypothetical protein